MGYTIREYHERSKHRLDRYAPGPGVLNWANQPYPWRTYHGAPRLPFALAADGLAARYNDLRRGALPRPAPLDLGHLGILFELSLALSAWKEYRGTDWALRCNPSSGNLHPTEAYLIAPRLPGIEPGVYHYLSRDHVVKQRAAAHEEWSGAFRGKCALVALSSIYWREAWKYGMRAYRYCQHDCGHAIAALAHAAAALGWQARVIDGVADDDIARLAGLDRDADFALAEREAPDVLMLVGERGAAGEVKRLADGVDSCAWRGREYDGEAHKHSFCDRTTNGTNCTAGLHAGAGGRFAAILRPRFAPIGRAIGLARDAQTASQLASPSSRVLTKYPG